MPDIRVALAQIDLKCFNLSRFAFRMEPLRARRKDTPILAPMIPLGQDGEVSWRLCFLASILNSRFSSKLQSGFAQEGTDLFGYLLRNRIIMVGSRIDSDVSSRLKLVDSRHEPCCFCALAFFDN